MEEQLVSFETAVLAKEKGFNIKTYFYYLDSIETYQEELSLYNEILQRDGIEKCKRHFRYNYPLYCAGIMKDGSIYGYDGKVENRIFFPTQALLQRWLREIHNIDIDVCKLKDGYKAYAFKNWDNRMDQTANFIKDRSSRSNTYEKALEVGLQEALKLI